MITFLLDRKQLVLTLHCDENCPKLMHQQVLNCGCSQTDGSGEQAQYCEHHIDLKQVKELTEGRFWILNFCEICYSK